MKKVWIGAGLVVVALGWYAFRPELLFVDTSVSESFPVAAAAADTSASAPKQLAARQFKDDVVVDDVLKDDRSSNRSIPVRTAIHVS